ncbi:MAG: hypothetical protein HFH99_05190 [Lachnospiraceae bacterium]|jgi:hypothetical protein|uniref:hypothetical protein n=2 Tax=uncultured Acetatifactor sp. TaxID=1671927 RepID=UPI0026394026|nr:hypothetical protein [uncultured Acetatifactor sp.]MCI8696161.1 hypothetical protein [Lachnospiraceae bacterium]
MLLDFGENPVVKCEALPYNKRNNSFISIFFPIGKRMLLPIGRAMEAMKRKKGLSENMLVDGEEVDAMPAIELVEHERTAYVKGMEDYLRELKLMPNNEAVRKSREILEKCHIIREDGEFSERYSNLGKYVQHRR